MALLLWLSQHFKDRLKTGDVFLVYLIVYPFGRFLLEFLRLIPRKWPKSMRTSL